MCCKMGIALIIRFLMRSKSSIAKNQRACAVELTKCALCGENPVLTLDPVAADRTEEVGVETMGLLNLIQQFSDVHHLQQQHSTNHYNQANAFTQFH